jgi:hypothetical protein
MWILNEMAENSKKIILKEKQKLELLEKFENGY